MGHGRTCRSNPPDNNRVNPMPKLAYRTAARRPFDRAPSPPARTRANAKAKGIPPYTARISVRDSLVDAVPPNICGTRAGCASAKIPIPA
ncbi:Uncharacterised protein [Mycobacteroides abscessus subsp. abscessus]|nr:Uncharacterised protein [Mycobacteroides abscessus subsp. abscessus]